MLRSHHWLLGRDMFLICCFHEPVISGAFYRVLISDIDLLKNVILFENRALSAKKLPFSRSN